MVNIKFIITSCLNSYKKMCILMMCLLFAVHIYLIAKPTATASYKRNGSSLSGYISEKVRIRYDFRIIVLTFNRAASLLRLLKSINDAEFEFDTVLLEVWIDRSDLNSVDHSVLKTAKTFSFRHGDYKVNIHQTKVGLFGQWLLTWKPDEGSTEIAVLLEDDLTVSKYFYKYLKAVHRKYDHRSEVNGYTLQASQITFTVNKSSVVKCPQNNFVYLYPVLGSWGFSPNNKNWNHFLEWYSSESINKTTKPYIPGHKATVWYKALEKQGKADTMWTIWHIYHAWKYNEFTLYYNFQENRGLAANWKEKGLHFGGNVGATNPLLTELKIDFERDLPHELVYVDITGEIIVN